MSIQQAVYSHHIPAYLTSCPSAIYNRKEQLLDNCIALNQERKERDKMEIASMPLEQYLTNYYMSLAYQPKESTHKQRLTYIASLSHYAIAHMPLKELNRFVMRGAIAEMCKTHRRATIRSLISIMRKPLQEAFEDGIIKSNPLNGIELPSEQSAQPKRDITPYTPEEQQAFIAACKASKHDAGAANILLLETGLRVGELLALDIDDVDLRNNTLTVDKTVVCSNSGGMLLQAPKTKTSQRTIPLSATAREIFLRQREKNGDKGYWFCSREGRLTYGSMLSATKTICKRAGVEYRGEHVLRHTFATNKVQEGAPIITVSRFLGHSNTIITQQTYVSVFNTSLDDMRQIVH